VRPDGADFSALFCCFFLLVVEGAVLLGVSRFPQGKFVVICGAYRGVLCGQCGGLAAIFCGSENAPVFLNLFLYW
jgi:hypothetical protein